MVPLVVALVSIILLIVGSPAGAFTRGDWDQCVQQKLPDLAVAACTRIIQAAGDTPIGGKAYGNRGIGYDLKGDHDRAIEDYNEAIKIDPEDAFPYNNRGNAYRGKGEYDRAITDYNKAIELDPKFAMAYNNRGAAYKGKGDNERAIADYSQAITLNQQFALAFVNRGSAYKAQNEYERAIADFTAAIQISPADAKAYLERGVARLYSGALSESAADLERAHELDPHDAYMAIWLEIANKRNNLPSTLASAATQLDMDVWPASIVRLFLNESTIAAVLAAAAVDDTAQKKIRICGGNFYSGEIALQNADRDQAVKLFKMAVDECPKDLTEFDAANAELIALGEQAKKTAEAQHQQTANPSPPEGPSKTRKIKR
jgi:lipoprotein NlpI